MSTDPLSALAPRPILSIDQTKKQCLDAMKVYRDAVVFEAAANPTLSAQQVAAIEILLNVAIDSVDQHGL